MSKQEPDNATYQALLRRLLESGEWDRIYESLKDMISESGWTDDVKGTSKEHARTHDGTTFQALLDTIRDDAQNSIPLAVKKDIVPMIRQAIMEEVE